MKFIHTADIHLDSPLHRLEVYEGAPVDDIRQASRRAFENLIDLALGEAVDFVLIAGDLFDGNWKDYNTGLYFISQVRRLAEADIAVYIVAGNHDAAGQMTRSLPYPSNVHVFSAARPETRILEHLKVAIHGQSYATSAVTDNLALYYPDPLANHVNIGLLHTSLTGRQGHENYAPCTLDDLINKGYDYWALGHVHQGERVAGAPPVIFPGCIQGRHIRESGAKGCVLVSMEAGEAPEIIRHDLDVIRWEHVAVELSGVTTIDECLARFRKAFVASIERHDPIPVIARVRFVGETDLHTRIAADVEYIKQSLRSAALTAFGERAWIEKVIVATRQPVSRADADPGPLHELGLLVQGLMTNTDDLLTLGGELAALFQKLPADYRQGEARLRLEDPAQLRGLVDQAHALLVRRLKNEADSP
jgi:DNA repair protein SbcD/Mre11